MDVQILDLDGSMTAQQGLVKRYGPAVLPAQGWGPKIRMGCSFGRFKRFERALATLAGLRRDEGPRLIFYGSGDFHHVSLALVRRLEGPFNLLVLDNHPDWMRGVPLLHCGTWLYHAARLPQVRRIFHVGGEVDFDNYYRWMAPWHLLRRRKITVLPAVRRFRGGPWAEITHEPLRADAHTPACEDRIEELLRPWRGDLAGCPLYISLDKDVLRAAEAVVNWDSGQLTLAEVCAIVRAFLRRADGHVAGVDVVGDWSPVELRGRLRRAFHWTEHPALVVDAADAACRNEHTNLALLEDVLAAAGIPKTMKAEG